MLEAIKFSGVLFLPLLLIGCVLTDPVLLRHLKTGQTVQCGPYRYDHHTAVAIIMQERGCIEDYQRQGYERVPK